MNFRLNSLIPRRKQYSLCRLSRLLISSMRTPFFLLFSLILLATLQAFTLQVVLAQPSLTSTDRALVKAVCNGQTPEFPVLTGRKQLLLINTDGSTSSLQDALPSSSSAGNLDKTGAVGCVTVIETTLENCDFGLLFGDIPRVRQDYLIQFYSLETMGNSPLDLLVTGETPAACDNAGTIDSTVKRISGDLASPSAVMLAIENQLLDTQDLDEDGYSNLEEFAQGSDPLDGDSPGMEIVVSANNTRHLVIAEGEAITLSISLNPGSRRKARTEYFLYADSLAGMFAYFYPKRFEPVNNRERAVTGPALRFNDVNIITLPALGVGEYEVVFEVEIEDEALLRDVATITVVPNDWQFTPVTEAAGLEYKHGFSETNTGSAHDRRSNSAGVAAGDYDGDGWIDLYIPTGTNGPNLLFRNLGNGTFEETGSAAGVTLTGEENTGATFADLNGDGWLDLIVLGMNGTQPSLFMNIGNGTFEDISADSGFSEMSLSYGASFADYDRDGDLDLWINHWLFAGEKKYLWENDGTGFFMDVTDEAGIPGDTTADFTTNFADINSDGWLDLLISGDYESSQVMLSNQDGTFSLTTTEIISDENGMGGAVGDYDNDGDLDWFVTSIYDYRTYQDYPWGITGNRFYQNDGKGNFQDVTDETGTRIGHWGWGACFADFNNDGWLDLFHVNGFSGGGDASVSPFLEDYSQLFISDQNGGFLERAIPLGISDNRQGRGIVCFDYDRDGDIDLFIANNRQAPVLYRNDSTSNGNYLNIKLEGEQKNSEAVGARIYLTTNGITQMRELRVGSNYMSQNPVEAHFGLGTATAADMIRIVWPSGTEKILEDVDANQMLFISLP